MVTEHSPTPKARAKKESGTMANYYNGYKKNETQDIANYQVILQKNQRQLHHRICEINGKLKRKLTNNIRIKYNFFAANVL
tara:strand:- start:38 stop:280 length:243 start_codon:yes stop_codon:yes gene_type:complete